DLNVRGVERLDHGAECVVLVVISRSAAVAVVRGEKAQWVVTPVVPLLGVELKDGHKFHRGDAQVFEIRDLLDQPRESAAPLWTRAGVRVDREPPNVQ